MCVCDYECVCSKVRLFYPLSQTHEWQTIPRPHWNEEQVFPSSSQTRPVLPHFCFGATKFGLVHHLVLQGLSRCGAWLGSLHFSTAVSPESDGWQLGSILDSPGRFPNFVSQLAQALH